MSIREHFDTSEDLRITFESSRSQEVLKKAIASYAVTHALIQRQALFSDNEVIEDVVSSEIRYFLTEYHLANLLQQLYNTIQERRATLESSLLHYTAFLELCTSYAVVPEHDRKLVASFLENKANTQASLSDPANARTQKIQRIKNDKILEQYMLQLKSRDLLDDESTRSVAVSSIQLAISRSLQEIESAKLELSILQNRPVPQKSELIPQDPTKRPHRDTNDWTLDRKPEMLDQHGKVLSPFIITSKRDKLRSEIYRPDHSLPTMSIDEYLELERARGGILEKAERPSAAQEADLKDDDDDQIEIERRAAIAWDYFTEQNPKGIGNTMNRG